MRLVSAPLALAFAVLVVAELSADQEIKGKGKKLHAIHGRVVAVKKDADKDSGAIEIALHVKKRTPGGQSAVKFATFKVTPDTKFEFVQRESNGQINRKPATFADVKKGERVAIVPMEGAKEVAQRIEILFGKKGGQSAATKLTPK